MQTKPLRLWEYFVAVFLTLGMAVVLVPTLRIPFVTLFISALATLNFLFHEFGHLVFAFAGTFIGVLGGTVGQLILPSGMMLTSYLRRSAAGVCFGLFWLGQNLINISIYVSDARAMALPLFAPLAVISGVEPIHDWNYLLGKMGLLAVDRVIGGTIWALGTALMVSAAAALILYPYLGGITEASVRPWQDSNLRPPT